MWGIAKISAPLWLILALVIAHPRTITPWVAIGGSATSFLYFTVAALAAVGILLCMHATPHPSLGLLPLLPFTPLLLPLVSSAANEFDADSVTAAGRPLFVAGLVAVYSVLLVREHPEMPRQILTAFAWAGVPLAALAVQQAITSSWGIYDDRAVLISNTSLAFPDRAAATFGHPSIYGLFAALAITAAIVYRPRLWGLIVIANGVGLALTASRSAVFAAVVGVACALLLARRSFALKPPSRYALPNLAILVGSVTASLLIAWDAIGEYTQTAIIKRFNNLDDDLSFEAHESRRDLAINIITAEWSGMFSGHGPQSAAQYVGTNGLGDRFAATFDNAYIVTIIDYGLLGLALIIGLALAALRRSHWFYTPFMAVFAMGAYSYEYEQWAPLMVFPAMILGFAAVKTSPKETRPPQRQSTAAARLVR